MRRIAFFLVGLLIAGLACSLVNTSPGTPAPVLSRADSLPDNVVKITPDRDPYPPQSYTEEYEDPVPLPYPINTAGAEDSAFITPDGSTLYLWFTPDPRIPPEEQLTDGVTGIYAAYRTNGAWSDPQRISLQDPGKLALDGCEFVLGNKMWFCSAREGYSGVQWFTAERQDGNWSNWQEAGFDPEYEVGELHITPDGNELYFHSSRPGGQGGYDIWRSKWRAGAWQAPDNLEIVNSAGADGWPFISPDGNELWFTRAAGAPELWRSTMVDSQWGQPEKMFAPFAGEASMDNRGNLYFTHHFYKEDRMLEADIYVAYRKFQ
ncbi:MAG: PD40 domain-containing protein [Anaerolineales bacterium]|nr:PD40 domain-containing protein [Anaerolineales bacterium]